MKQIKLYFYFTLLAFCFTLLAGCEIMNMTMADFYERPGTSSAQRSADYKQCEYEAALATAGISGMQAGARQNQLEKMCMQLLGYRK